MAPVPVDFMRKFTVPEIAPEEMTPEVAELLEVAKQLVDMVTRNQEKVRRQDREIARLRRKKKRS